MSWQAAVPITLALAGLFHYFLAQIIMDSEKSDEYTVLAYSWLAFAFLFVLASLYSVHLYAASPAHAINLTSATRPAYIIGLVSFAWSTLFILIKGFQHAFTYWAKTGSKWRR